MQRSAACTLALLAGLSFLVGAGVARAGESAVSYTVVAQGLDEPRGLLFLPSGDLVVAETKSGRILKLSGARW